MHFTATIILTTSLTLSSPTTALPISTTKRQASNLCSGLSGAPNCCDVNLLDAADLQCEKPPTLPTSVPDFISVCAAIGQDARCCTLDLLDQGLLCTAPQG